MVNPDAPSVGCPAWFFCAPASGQGKTTITAGLARYHRNQGRRVRVFKTGPDFLDPLMLARAAGTPVSQLDLWMTGEAACQRILFDAAQQADIILIEGVMGMFDGEPSAADMAAFFGIPIAIVINARAMAQTFAAIAQGLVGHRPSLSIAGVIANGVASARHEGLIRDAMPPQIKLLGCVHRQTAISLPERHLGLVAPHEVVDIEARLDRLAEVVAAAGLTELPPRVNFSTAALPAPAKLLRGVRVGIAKDAAFSFIYAANVKLLEDMAAEVKYFSPLVDTQLPDVDALWLPGGYPELHLQQLADNTALQQQIRAFHRGARPILAECGGMLYLMQSLTTAAGVSAPLLSLLPGHARLRDRGGCQGMQYAPLPEGELRAHAHHRTQCEGTLQPIAFGRRAKHPARGEAIYRHAGITASYLHLYFPSNPAAIAHLLRGETNL